MAPATPSSALGAWVAAWAGRQGTHPAWAACRPAHAGTPLRRLACGASTQVSARATGGWCLLASLCIGTGHGWQFAASCVCTGRPACDLVVGLGACCCGVHGLCVTIWLIWLLAACLLVPQTTTSRRRGGCTPTWRSRVRAAAPISTRCLAERGMQLKDTFVCCIAGPSRHNCLLSGPCHCTPAACTTPV